MTKIFEDFGIYAVSNTDETCILSSLLNAEPILLIGPPGTAKTEIMYMIGLLFRESSKKKNPCDPSQWYNFNIYDTSKLNFEDLIGWPNPKELQEGKVSFIPSPTTIWDKDIIGLDELNRCTEDRQANILEVLRHRTCMGQPTKVKFIFSGINPYGDAGTNNMSEALADRHTFFIHFAPFDSLDSENRIKIMKRVGNFDSLGIKYWTGKKYKFDALKDFDANGNTVFNDELATQGDRLMEIINRAASIYDDVHNQYHATICSLIDTIINRLTEDFKDSKDKLPSISGRRAGMMARAFVSYRAIDIARATILGTIPSTLNVAIQSVMTSAMPFGIDKPVSSDVVTRVGKIIADAVSFWQSTVLSSEDADTNFSYDLHYTPSPIEKLELLLKHPNIDNLVVNTAWNNILDKDTEIATIAYTLSQTLGSTAVPDHFLTTQRLQKIADSLASLKSDVEYSPVLRKWESTITPILAKAAKNCTAVHCVVVMTVNYLNRVAVNDSEVVIGINHLNNLVDTCTKLIETKKVERGITENKTADSSESTTSA